MKFAKPDFWIFCSSQSSSVELPYRQSGKSILNGFYTKRLLSVVCMILTQHNLCNFTRNYIIFLFVGNHFQAFLDTYTYSTSAFVPIKILKVRKTMKFAKPDFWIFCSLPSSSSVELPYRQSGKSILNGFYTKRLLSVVCMILNQHNLCNFTRNYIIEKFSCLLETIFCMCTCIPHFIER